MYITAAARHRMRLRGTFGSRDRAFPADVLLTRRGGWLHVHRGDLQKAILDRVKSLGGQNVEIHTGQAVIDVDPTTPSVTLTDGIKLSADVIIGADGIKSACRAAFFPEQNDLVSSAYAYRFQLPASLYKQDPPLTPLMSRHTSMGRALSAL